MAMMSRDEIIKMGFASVGENVLLSDRASFYNCGNISLGNNVRIDDFCVLSAGTGGIAIGDYVHIAVYCSLIGAGRISLADFSGLSSRVAVYSSNEDYTGEWMTNPTVPSEYAGRVHANVTIGRHAIVGAGTVIMPGVVIEEGVAIGALSFVRKRCEEFGIYSGSPLRRIAERKRNLLELEKKLLSDSKYCR
jgi:galactoside O-acetyltransferase